LRLPASSLVAFKPCLVPPVPFPPFATSAWHVVMLLLATLAVVGVEVVPDVDLVQLHVIHVEIVPWIVELVRRRTHVHIIHLTVK